MHDISTWGLWYILYILKHLLTVQPIASNGFYQGTHATTQTTILNVYYVIIVHNYAVDKLCTSSKLKLLIVLWTPCCTIPTILYVQYSQFRAYFGLNIKCYGSRYLN